MTRRRIGVLGGTFDPIHCGHVDAAGAAHAALGLSELLIVPSHIPPHRAEPSASGYHRFAMVALAAAVHPAWRASDVELIDPSLSYTARTLARLQAGGYRPTELFFVVGADAFAEIATWRDYPALLDRAHFAVVSRPLVPVGDLPGRLPDLTARFAGVSAGALASPVPLIFLIDAPTADVSSTEIRRRRAAGESIAGLVPPAVEQYIERHGLYRRDPAGDRPAGAPAHSAAGRLHGQG